MREEGGESVGPPLFVPRWETLGYERKVEAQAARDRIRSALAELSGSEAEELGRLGLEAELELVEACIAIAGR